MLKKLKKNIPNIILVSVSTIILLSIFVVSIFDNKNIIPLAEAGDDQNLSGYAWSDNIGWISFNSNNGDDSGNIDYGVNIDNYGLFSGYAWSDNIGWISFESSDLSGCPGIDCRAWRDGNNILGWAKALSADGNGWDGWISLNTLSDGINNVPYGWYVDDGVLKGDAWGSDVIGWVRLDHPFASGGDEVVLEEDPTEIPAINSFVVNSAPNGSTPRILWTTTNMDVCTLNEVGELSREICDNIGDCSSGTTQGYTITTTPAEYTLGCEGSYGGNSYTPVIEPTTQPEDPYVRLAFVDGFSENLTVKFVVAAATTSATRINVIPYNSFSGDVTVKARVQDINKLPNGSCAIYYPENLDLDGPCSSSFEIENVSVPKAFNFKIFLASDEITGTQTIEIGGGQDALAPLEVKVGAESIVPIFEEI
ncbi:MAG: hypothetical protein KAR54_02450 [Candidatus Pacebacteria bacterium]|nr:hypothetical protein [Candidatus Paceibacterota bacterium]